MRYESNPAFYECECDRTERYVHPFYLEKCPKCGVASMEYPASLKDVRIWNSDEVIIEVNKLWRKINEV